MWTFLSSHVLDVSHDIYWFPSYCPACSRNPFPLWCHRAALLLLMPATSLYLETHQSARCLIGSERWERIAICTPAPKSSLWTCHSRRITCSRRVLLLTKGSPISAGRDNYTHTPFPSCLAAQTQVDICQWHRIAQRTEVMYIYSVGSRKSQMKKHEWTCRNVSEQWSFSKCPALILLELRTFIFLLLYTLTIYYIISAEHFWQKCGIFMFILIELLWCLVIK